MPHQKKDKDGKVTEEFSTVQPTPEQAQKNKQDRIAAQIKAREKFEKSRKQAESKTEPPAQPVAVGAGSKSQSAAS